MGDAESEMGYKDAETNETSSVIDLLERDYADAFNPNSNVLNLGCGNSEVARYMFEDKAYKNLVSVDVSETLIAKMKEKYSAMEFHAVDAQDMKQLFKDGQFDVVLDKGTLDAVED